MFCDRSALLIRALFSLAIVLIASQVVWAQSATTPELRITVELPESIDPEEIVTQIVSTRGERLFPERLELPSRFSVKLPPGVWTAKALIPGWGADEASLRVSEDTHGAFSITLRPHRTALDKYVDDYRLEWIGVKSQYFVPESDVDALHFVDVTGERIQITDLTDARLRCSSGVRYSLSIRDFFSVESDGAVRITAPDELRDRLISCDVGLFDHKLTLSAINADKGLAYEASTKRFRFGHVPVTGRLVLGSSIIEQLPLANVEVKIGQIVAKTDDIGFFAIDGIATGEISVSAHAIGDMSSNRGVRYRARGNVDVEGPAELQLVLEKWDASKLAGAVTVVSQTPLVNTDGGASVPNSAYEPDIPVNVRFKMVNLVRIDDLEYTTADSDAANDICKEARDRGWRMQYCPSVYLGTRVANKPVWSGPEPDATRLGELIIDPEVWYVPRGTRRPALVVPEYLQGDWGYSSYGYAVTVLAMKKNRVAIHLPQTDDIGWIDFESLEDFQHDPSASLDRFYLGFSPRIEHCLSSFGNELVVVESVDEHQFVFRYPTAHDLWSVYDGTKRPPQSPTTSHAVNWREAYSSDRRLLLVPNPGKEC